MVRNGIVKNEEQDIYTYGLQQGFIILLNILTTIAIGLFFGMLWQSIIFMIAYIPLRSYAGGYHARTQFRCYWFSVLMISLVLGLMKLINWTSTTNTLCLTIALFAVVLIFYLAPVADDNKPLDMIEINVYKKKARNFTFILFGIILLFWSLGIQQISICIVCALAVESVMLILGYIGKN